MAAAALFATAGFVEINGRDGSWVASLATQKRAIAERVEGRRILIVAGSNALFGIDARQMSVAFDTPVINMALHAGLSWRFYRHFVLPEFREGDIALLPLELRYFTSPKPMNSLTVEAGHSMGLDFLLDLPLSDALVYARSLSMDFLTSQFGARYLSSPPPPANGYWRYPLDERGDIELPSDAKAAETMLVADGNGTVAIDIGGDAKLICDDIASLHGRGIRVIATEPNIYLSDDKKSRYAILRGKIAAFIAGCGGEFVGVASQGLQPRQRMFDTEYHLNPAGRLARTIELIDALRPFVR